MENPKALRLPGNLHMEVHEVLHLPQNLHMEFPKVLRLPCSEKTSAPRRGSASRSPWRRWQWHERGRRPNVEEVKQRTQGLRVEQTYLDLEAAGTIREAEELVSAVEHEIRIYVHNLTTFPGRLPGGGPECMPPGGASC